MELITYIWLPGRTSVCLCVRLWMALKRATVLQWPYRMWIEVTSVKGVNEGSVPSWGAMEKDANITSSGQTYDYM